METAVKTKIIEVTQTDIDREIEAIEAQYGDEARRLINLWKGMIVPGSDEDVFNLGPIDNNIYRRGWL